MDFKSYIQSDVIFQGSSTNRYLRFVETIGQFNGAYLQFEGSTNKLHMGVHDAADANPANDTKVLTMQRSDGFIGINNENPSFNLDINGTFNSDGARIEGAFTNIPARLAVVNPSFGGTRLGDSALQTPTLDIGTAMNFMTTGQVVQWAAFSNASGNTLTWRHAQNPTALFSIANSGTGLTNGVDDIESTLGLVTEYDTGDPHVYDLFNQNYPGAGSALAEAQGVNMIAPVGDHRKYGIYRAETGLTNITTMFEIDGVDLANQIATFFIPTVVPDEAYGVSWDGNFEVPTKNAIYDQIESLAGGGDLLAANNLSDVADVTTSRNNLLAAGTTANNNFSGFLNTFQNNVTVNGELTAGDVLNFGTFTGNLSTQTGDAAMAYLGSGQFGLRRDGSSNGLAVFDINSLTGIQTYTLPIASGTIALTSDIPATGDFVTTNTSQTISGSKTFTGSQTFNFITNFRNGFPQFNRLDLFPHTPPGTTPTVNAYFGLDTSNRLYWKNIGSSSIATFDSSALTSSQNYELPNASGTLALLSDIPTGGTPTGLEAISEGGNNGWRLIGRDPLNYGDIGNEAIDFTISGGASTTVGATGDFSVTSGGFNNTASGSQSSIMGGTNNVASGVGSAVGGGVGNVSSSASTFASGGDTTASGSYSFAAGRFNTAFSFGEAVFGAFATEYVPVNATNFDAADRIFNIGNGTATGSRSDALTILKSGEITAPSLSNAIIDAAPSSVLVTKDYADTNYVAEESGTFTPVLNGISGVSSSGAFGRYVRQGKLVFVYISFTGVSAPAISTGIPSISGLPFTPLVAFGNQLLVDVTDAAATQQGSPVDLDKLKVVTTTSGGGNLQFNTRGLTGSNSVRLDFTAGTGRIFITGTYEIA